MPKPRLMLTTATTDTVVMVIMVDTEVTTDIPMEVILTATPPGTMVDSLPTVDTLPPTTTTTDTCSKQSDLFLPNTKLYLPNQYHPSKVISSKL